MKTSVTVKLQTGFFERTDFKLIIAADGLVFKPIAKTGNELVISGASIKTVTFYEAKLKMEIHSDKLTDVYFANENDWQYAMKALKEKSGVKIICELN